MLRHSFSTLTKLSPSASYSKFHHCLKSLTPCFFTSTTNITIGEPWLHLYSSRNFTNISRESETSQKVIEIAKKFCSNDQNINLYTNLESFDTNENRKWDCLDTVEFLIEVENAFNILIPDEDANAVTSIQDAIDCVSKISKTSTAN